MGCRGSGLHLRPLEGSKREGDIGRFMLCSGCRGDGDASREVGRLPAGVRPWALLGPSSCEECLHLTLCG